VTIVDSLDIPVDGDSPSFSQALIQSSLLSDPPSPAAKEEPYTLALHSVKVRRTGTTVEAKSLYELGVAEKVLKRLFLRFANFIARVTDSQPVLLFVSFKIDIFNSEETKDACLC